MKRDLNRLASQNFDLVVIGGGIQGAAVALEAAHCGLQTALVEKGDFGHATSANSLKILHGGFRYLQSLDLHRMRSSIWSRNFFMRLAPHLVQPLPCVIPTHGCGLRGKYPMGLGLLLNDMIAWDRNVGLDHDKRLPMGKLISLQKCSREMPEVSVSGKSGGAVWYDALAVDTERMTLAVVKEAAGLGVCAANYCRATELRIARNRIYGLWAQDVLSGQSFPVFSSVIIDATGPWLQHSLLPKAQARQHISWARGVNIVVRKRLSASMAMGLEGDSVNGHHSRGRGEKKKRFFFFVPWGGYTMVGTVYTRHDGPPEKMTVSRHDLQSMIDEIRSIHPGSGLKYEDISFYHAGLLPMDSGVVSNNGISLHQKESIIDHEYTDQISGLYSVQGVKYTTAPHVAKKLIKRIKLKKSKEYKSVKSSLSIDAESWGDAYTHKDEYVAKMNFDPLFLFQRYGSEAKRILGLLAQDTDLSGFVSLDPPVLAAEIVHAVQQEMAVSLGDIVFRRTGMGSAARPKPESLRAAADVLASELGWDEQTKDREIQEVFARYSPLEGIGDA